MQAAELKCTHQSRTVHCTFFLCKHTNMNAALSHMHLLAVYQVARHVLQAKANRGILYVDEVNLLDDGLVDVVLDSAASGLNTVEREGVSIIHPAKFIMLGSGNPMVRSLTLHSMSCAVALSGWKFGSLHMLSQKLSACDHGKQMQGLLTVQMHVVNRQYLVGCTI